MSPWLLGTHLFLYTPFYELRRCSNPFLGDKQLTAADGRALVTPLPPLTRYTPATQSHKPHLSFSLKTKKTKKNQKTNAGVRTAAFAAGGVLPKQVKGSRLEGFIHIVDWYATFCGLAGVSAQDNVPGLPPVDSLDMWPLLSGENTTSPRVEFATDIECDPRPRNGTIIKAGLISGRYKLVVGRQLGTGWWWGPEYPNSTTKLPSKAPGCYPACLFDILADPGEHIDLIDTRPELYATLWKKLLIWNASVFQSDAGGTNDYAGAAAGRRGGYWRPWLP